MQGTEERVIYNLGTTKQIINFGYNREKLYIFSVFLLCLVGQIWLMIALTFDPYLLAKQIREVKFHFH